LEHAVNYWEALILGVVEGVTEFLPVSSTGHLVLASRALGLTDSEGHKAFEIVMQAGAILAVAGVFFPRIREMARGLFGRSPEGLRLALRLVLAFAVTSAVALAFEKPIKARLFRLEVVAWAWIAGGLAIFSVERWRTRHRPTRTLADLALRDAAVIGLMQAFALCPGVSRSLVTLVGGILVGLSLPAALEFSFLLGGLTLTAAAGYEGLKNREEIRSALELGPALVACTAAAVSAWAVVRWMLAALNRVGLMPFAWYRLALGTAVLLLIAAGRL
jgi:undecaprenyl-diphosphatase